MRIPSQPALILFLAVTYQITTGPAFAECKYEDSLRAPDLKGVQLIENGPDICSATDLSAYCKQKQDWIQDQLFKNAPEDAPCTSHGTPTAPSGGWHSSECVANLKEKFETQVVPTVRRIFDQLLNHSDYVNRCCLSDESCKKKLRSVTLNLTPNEEGSTGFGETIAPNAITMGFAEAFHFNEDIETATLMHELGHACHEILAPVPYEDDAPRARAMEKLLSERFGPDFVPCLQEEFIKRFKDPDQWVKDPKTYSAGLNRLYNETFAEAFVAPIAPKIYQGWSCGTYIATYPDWYYESLACRFKTPRLKAQWCSRPSGK